MQKTNKTKTSKSKPRTDKSAGFLKSILSFFKDEKFKVCLGLSLILIALLMSLSFISYFFTWKEDQSLLKIGFLGLFSHNDFQIENWMGKLGAFLSNRFIHDWFGIASFAFPVILVAIGFNLLNVKFVKISRFVFISLICCIWFSVFLASIFVDKFFMVGGAHGFFIFRWLCAIFGKIGAYVTILLVGFVIFVYTFKDSISVLKKFFSLFKLKNKEDLIEKLNDEFDNNDSVDNAPVTDRNIDNVSNDAITIVEDNFQTNLQSDSNSIDLTDVEYSKDKKKNEKVIDFEEITLSYDNDIAEEEVVEPKEKEEDEEVSNDENQDDLTLDVNEIVEEELLTDEEMNNDILQDFDPTKDLEYYKYPTIDLLTEHQTHRTDIDKSELNANKDRIVRTLRDYKIEIEKISATIGPTVTLYEIVPAPGVRIAKIKNLEDDIALSLSALGIRIIAPIPGKGTIGIEVPNSKPEIVSMRSVIKSSKFHDANYELPIAIGKTISNETYVFNLAKTPHLLVAGATGQGKSVGVNAIITSLLYKKHPSQLKFVLVDPKMVELSIYKRIEKHFLAKLPDEENPIITDVSKVVPVMNSLCIEMDKRYQLLTDANVRDIVHYNEKFIKRKLNPLKGHFYMPYIVVIIDEFADIIVQEGKQVEAPISRLAAKARAIGIHLIVATQRPSTDVITGVIKANFPSRIAFKVTNGHDSKTILDTSGANQLIGRGDMLISESGKITRVQCAFVDTPEVDEIVEFISKQQAYSNVFELPEPEVENNGGGAGFDPSDRDELFEEAARIVVRHQQGSTSLIQRKMSIGYNRAGRIIDQLEAVGIVGSYEGSKARQVHYPDEYSLEQYLTSLDNK